MAGQTLCREEPLLCACQAEGAHRGPGPCRVAGPSTGPQPRAPSRRLTPMKVCAHLAPPHLRLMPCARCLPRRPLAGRSPASLSSLLQAVLPAGASSMTFLQSRGQVGKPRLPCPQPLPMSHTSCVMLSSLGAAVLGAPRLCVCCFTVLCWGGLPMPPPTSGLASQLQTCSPLSHLV